MSAIHMLCYGCGAKQEFGTRDGHLVIVEEVECTCQKVEWSHEGAVPTERRFCKAPGCGVEITERAANAKYCHKCSHTIHQQSRGTRATRKALREKRERMEREAA